MVLGLSAHAARPDRPARATSPEWEALLATPVGARPADEMHWPQVLETLGRPTDATRLREWLLGQWLQQVSGEAPAAPQPLKAVLTAPPATMAPRWDAAAQARWQRAFNRHLVALLPTVEVPLPGEIEALRPQLTDLAPGRWLLRDRAGTARTLYAWVELKARGPAPFPSTGFSLTVSGRTGECTLPRDRLPRLLPPGSQDGVLCAWTLADASPSATALAADLAQAVTASDATGALQPDPLDRDGVRLGLAAALAEPKRAERDAWLLQSQQAELGRSAAERAVRESAARAEGRWKPLIGLAVVAGVVIAIVAGFLWLARRYGPGRAAVVVWAVGMLVCLPLAWHLAKSAREARDLGSLVMFFMALSLVVAPTFVALALSSGFASFTRLVSDASYRRDVGIGLLVIAVLLLAEALLE